MLTEFDAIKLQRMLERGIAMGQIVLVTVDEATGEAEAPYRVLRARADTHKASGRPVVLLAITPEGGADAGPAAPAHV